MLIILIGPPGSGKGTQGKFLANKINLPHVSIGEVFRKVSEQNNEVGILLNDYIKQGRLVPSHIADRIVKEFLSSESYKTGYILDGYPRSIEQAKFLDTIDNQPKYIIYFEINEHLILKRILGRVTCRSCNTSFNINIDDPLTSKICNNCGSSDFFLRNDDNKDIIDERIKVYNKETYPLIEYYKNEINNFYTINASLTKEEVLIQLLEILKKI